MKRGVYVKDGESDVQDNGTSLPLILIYNNQPE